MTVSIKKVVRNASSNVARFALAGVVRFFLTPFIVLHLGAEGYGLWALALAAIGLLTLLEFGFATAVVWATARTEADDDQRRHRRLSTLGILHVALAIISLPLLATLVIYFPQWFQIPDQRIGEGQLVLLLLGIRFALVTMPLGFFRNILFGQQHISAINAVQIGVVLVYALMVWLVVGQGGSIVDLAWIHLAMGVLEYGSYGLIYRWLESDIKLQWRFVDLGLLPELLSFSGSSFIIGISGFILLKTDPILVQVGLSLTAVALYAIALKITENLHLLLKQVVNVLSPVVADLDSEGHRDGLRLIFVDVARHALWVGSLPTVALIVLGESTLTYWVGPEFASAAATLSVLLVAMTLLIPQLVAANIMTMSGHHRFVATASIVGSVLNIAASLVYIFLFDLGLVGVALGTMTAVVVVDCGLILWRTCRHLQSPYLAYLKTVFAPTILCGALQLTITLGGVSWWPPTNLLQVMILALPGVVISAGVYLATYAREDLRRWKALSRNQPGSTAPDHPPAAEVSHG